MSLKSEERKKIIIREIEDNGQVKTIFLVNKLKVSHETIRRDLEQLERNGLLKRVYGGAIQQSLLIEPPYSQRQQINFVSKEKIGAIAVECIDDGDTIAIDCGTTTLELAKSIQGKKNITIITNSLPVSVVLVESITQHQFTGQVILLGGIVNTQQQSISGPITQKMLESFLIDKAFISIGGISLNNGITDYDLNETLLSQMFMKRSKKNYILSDSSKFGLDASCQLAALHEIDVIISEIPSPKTWRRELENLGITWLYPKGVEQ